MVVILQIILLVGMTAVSVAVLTVMVRVLQDAAKRRLLAETGFTLCDAPDMVGVSVLYSGTGRLRSVAEMLDVGYGRYELVLVVDSLKHDEDFALLLSHYSLIGVCHTLDEELPVGGVRGLYRSRKRCFRRLVVVDKAFTTVDDDLDAAAGVATYDYVLPMRTGWRLMPNAVGRLAAELSEHPFGSVSLVWSLMGVPALLMEREIVIRAGGFSRKPWRAVSRARRRMVYEPLLRSERPPLHLGRGWSLLWASLVIGGAVAAAWMAWWVLCALLLTGMVVWAAVRVVAPLITKGTGFAVDGPAAVEFLLRKFNVKNFSIS